MRRLSIRKKIDNTKLREKLMIAYMIVVFLPVLLVGFILSYSIRTNIVDNAMREATVNVERVYSRVDDVMKLVMDISYKMQMDQELEDLLLADYKSTQEVFDAYFRYREFENTINLYSNRIRDIRIYSSNKSLLDSGQFVKLTAEKMKDEWYKKVDIADGRICWQYLPNEARIDSSMCLTRIVRTLSSYKVLGALIISLNNDHMNELMKSEPYDTFLVDDLGNIFAAKDKEILGCNILDTQLSVTNGVKDGTIDIDYMDKPSKAVIKSFNPSNINGNFKIISIVPISVLEEQVGSSALLVAGIMTSSLLIAFVLILIFSNALSKRLKILSNDMHKVAMGNFEVSTEVTGEDEIGQLSRDLNVMTDSLRELVEEVYITKAQKDQLSIQQKEIKLEMLASQINPHFLFNTLETIRMKAHCLGQDELADVVKLLGRIMRRNLEVGNEMITIESEIDFVTSYLGIQKFRYGDKINYEICYESEDIKEVKILPLIIQPIVENAIVHGLELKEGKGNVTVRLSRKNFYIVISVTDDGVGMSGEKLQEVLDSLNDTGENSKKSIGLKNVHNRLKMFYGETYGLRIFSSKNVGTTIDILMPGEG